MSRGYEIPSHALAQHFARPLRECDYCREAREDVKPRRWPSGVERATLCTDCWLDVQARWTKEREP